MTRVIAPAATALVADPMRGTAVMTIIAAAATAVDVSCTAAVVSRKAAKVCNTEADVSYTVDGGRQLHSRGRTSATQ
jgi:hypothetical protein